MNNTPQTVKGLRLLAVTPISVAPDELERRQHRYDRLAPQGVSVTLVNLGSASGIPCSLDSVQDIEASQSAMLERLIQEEESDGEDPYDGFLPDCVLDPLVDVAGTGLETPVFGLLKITSHYLRSLGAHYAAVARNRPIAEEIDAKCESYGLGRPLGGTRVLDLGISGITDEAAWAATIDARLQDSSARYVINGCSAVETSTPVRGRTLIDPTATALSILGMGSSTGILEQRKDASRAAVD